jgi:hypothetical protein
VENGSSAEMIARDTPCFRCGYNLRSLAMDGRCPECGKAVRLSMRGQHLAAADPRWRRRLRLGAGLHASGLIGFQVIVLSLFYSHRDGGALVLRYMFMVVAVSLGAAGAWLMAAPEPGGPYFDDGQWLRRFVRGLAVLSWSGMAGYAAIELREWRGYRSFGQMVLWQNILGVLGFGGGLLVTGLAIWHLSRLAKRMDGSRLVFYGRLSAFSSAIMVAVFFGVTILFDYLGVPQSRFLWLGMTLYGMLFLWPAAYQLVWQRRVGQITNPTS